MERMERGSRSLSRGEGIKADGVVTLNLLLKCKNSETDDVKELRLTNLPATTEELKRDIERCCNVPTCVQNLSFEAHPLIEKDDVQRARIRSGDTITVCYLAEGDCQEVLGIIGWMGVVLAVLRTENPTVSRGMSEQLNDLVTNAIEQEYIESLAFDYFFPWLDDKKYANKLHFINNGGLDIMMELYSLLQRETWGKCLLKMKYLEYGLLRVLWNLSETFALRRAIIRLGGLDLCMQSLMRETIMKGEAIVDKQSPKGANQDWVLIENIGAALGTLCNLSELPEVHVKIATQHGVLKQLICIALSPSVQIMSSILVATLFLCLAATRETHPFITVGIIGLMEACVRESDIQTNQQKERDNLLLKYFTGMFIAQLALGSPYWIPSSLCKSINHFLSQFLRVATYQEIRQAEIDHWYVWQTFMPYIKFAYLPHKATKPLPTTSHPPSKPATQPLTDSATQPLSKPATLTHHLPAPPTLIQPLSDPTTQLLPIITTTQKLSLQLMIFSLQNMLGREKHRQVLMEENLLDYITCMPWFVPKSLQQQAKDLVQMLANSPDVNMQPPKLVNITRACLANNCCGLGLENAVRLSAGEIATRLLTTTTK